MSFFNLDEWMNLARHIARKSGFAERYIQTSRENPPETGCHRWSLQEVRRGIFRLECLHVIVITDAEEFLPRDIDPGRDWARNQKLWLDFASGQAEHEITPMEDREVRYRIQAPYPKVGLTTCLSEDEIRRLLGTEVSILVREKP